MQCGTLSLVEYQDAGLLVELLLGGRAPAGGGPDERREREANLVGRSKVRGGLPPPGGSQDDLDWKHNDKCVPPRSWGYAFGFAMLEAPGGLASWVLGDAPHPPFGGRRPADSAVRGMV